MPLKLPWLLSKFRFCFINTILSINSFLYDAKYEKFKVSSKI